MSEKQETARDIIAEASYCNDVYPHNDPPLWEDCGVEGLSASAQDRAQHYANADFIIKSLEKSGFQIVKATGAHDDR